MSKTHLLLIEPLTTLLLYTSVFQKFNNLMTGKKVMSAVTSIDIKENLHKKLRLSIK